jgi:hypothetical protein
MSDADEFVVEFSPVDDRPRRRIRFQRAAPCPTWLRVVEHRIDGDWRHQSTERVSRPRIELSDEAGAGAGVTFAGP